MTNHIVWVDIPVTNLKRASGFYEKVLNTSLESIPKMSAAVFKHSDNGVSGCVIEDKEAKPSKNGPLIYLNVNNRLDKAIALVEKNGGKIIKPKHAIGPYGFRAIVLDSEGNRIALHSEK